MTTCYPDKIRGLPQYKDFITKIKKIEESNLTEYCKLRDKKQVAKKYGISLIPIYCDDRCPYKKICDKELMKMWKKIVNSNIDATAFRKSV